MMSRYKAHFIFGVFLLSLSATHCFSQKRAAPPRPVTQQRINEFAAALDRAIRTMVDDSGLRQPREQLPVYLNRIAVPLPEESRPEYRWRIERYLRALEEATGETALLRTLPALTDISPANFAVWERTTQSLRFLPARVQKLRGAWKQDHTRGEAVLKSQTLGQEFYRTLLLTLEARDGLRDARP